MRRFAPLAAAAVVATVAACLPAELLTVRTGKLGDGLTLVRGGGGNTVVLVKGERALVFDSKLWPYSNEVARVVAEAGARATILVNSHRHIDHVGGNALFSDATLVASARTIDALTSGRGRTTLPGGAAWLPVAGRTWLSLGGEPVLVGSLGAAHTNTDIFAWFPQRRTLVTGDVFDNGFYPHVDPAHGGRFLGLLQALDTLSEFDADVVIPGHGAPASRAELVASRDLMRSLRDEVLARRERGEPEDAILEAMRAARGEPFGPMTPVSSREGVLKGLLAETRPASR